MDEITTCVAYDCDGAEITDFPASSKVLEKASPVTKTFKGWKTPISDVATYDDLPENAKEYIRFIEEYTETPIDIVSVGYKRDQTFIRKPIWDR